MLWCMGGQSDSHNWTFPEDLFYFEKGETKKYLKKGLVFACILTYLPDNFIQSIGDLFYFFKNSPIVCMFWKKYLTWQDRALKQILSSAKGTGFVSLGMRRPEPNVAHWIST
jgi:hypothetical protein